MFFQPCGACGLSNTLRPLFRASFFTHMTDTLNTVQDDLSPAENISISAESAPVTATPNLATEIMQTAAMTEATPEQATAEVAVEAEAVAEAPNGFVELGLAPALVQACKDLGYTQPTTVQQKAIPLAMAGVAYKPIVQVNLPLFSLASRQSLYGLKTMFRSIIF